jgi:hypothetical protein
MLIFKIMLLDTGRTRICTGTSFTKIYGSNSRFHTLKFMIQKKPYLIAFLIPYRVSHTVFGQNYLGYRYRNVGPRKMKIFLFKSLKSRSKLMDWTLVYDVCKVPYHRTLFDSLIIQFCCTRSYLKVVVGLLI